MSQTSLITLFLAAFFLAGAPQGVAFPVIKNPSFENDDPGPLPIIGVLPSDWIVVGDAGTNPTMEHRGADGALLIDPYIVADNGIIPDGGSVFWLQNLEAETGEVGDLPVSEDELYAHLAQDISGFEPGKTYTLVYWENVRAAWGHRPLLTWAKLGGVTIDPPHPVSSVDAVGSHGRAYARRISGEISPTTAGPLKLAVYMTSAGRPTPAITPGVNYPPEVQGKRRGPGNLLLDHFQFVELGNLKLTNARRSTVHPDKITATFNGDLSEESLTNTINYTVVGGPPVTGVVKLAGNKVQLSVDSPLEDGNNFSLRVQGVVGTNNLGMFATNSIQPIDMAPIVPAEFGQSITCFQDDFNGAVMNSAWASHGPDSSIFKAHYGVLKMQGTVSGANDLLCQVSGYHSSVQEVLLKVRFVTLEPSVRLGAATVTDATTRRGLNFSAANAAGAYQTVFDDEGRGDAVASPFDLRPGTWYWMRLMHSPGAAGGSHDALGKIWLADNDTPEPAGFTFKYPAGSAARQGLAGIALTGAGQKVDAEIDYILIKADGTGFQKQTVELPGPIENPVFLTIQRTEGDVRITWPLDFFDYQLYYNDDLNQADSWIPVDPSLLGSDPEANVFTYTEPATGMRYYRLAR